MPGRVLVEVTIQRVTFVIERDGGENRYRVDGRDVTVNEYLQRIRAVCQLEAGR